MELKDRYRLRREIAFKRGKIPGWIRMRRMLHPALIRGVKLSRVIGKQNKDRQKD